MEELLFYIVAATGIICSIIALWAILKDKERVLKYIQTILYVLIIIIGAMVCYHTFKQ